ncbi:MAG: hypothetical protein WDN09_01965 [bacterium]
MEDLDIFYRKWMIARKIRWYDFWTGTCIITGITFPLALVLLGKDTELTFLIPFTCLAAVVVILCKENILLRRLRRM